MKQDTVLALFRQMNQQGIPYAVLRNYEAFPEFGHDIDMVIPESALQAFREILINLAVQFQWETLSECHHWATSSQKHHNIQVFRFYKIYSPAYLQVDIFHGFSLLGLSFMDENELLTGCVWDERGFNRIDPLLEALLKMLQVHRLMRTKPADTEKIIRYCQHVLHCLECSEEEFYSLVERKLTKHGLQALQALQHQDEQSFVKSMDAAKWLVFFNACMKYPVKVLSNVSSRAWDYCQMYQFHPCGTVLKIFAPGENQREVITGKLAELADAHLIYKWATSSNGKKSIRKRRILERGGLVVQWVARPENGAFDAEQVNDFLHAIVETLNRRHHVLYQQETEVVRQ